jgi:hypothetical protein
MKWKIYVFYQLFRLMWNESKSEMDSLHYRLAEAAICKDTMSCSNYVRSIVCEKHLARVSRHFKFTHMRHGFGLDDDDNMEFNNTSQKAPACNGSDRRDEGGGL